MRKFKMFILCALCALSFNFAYHADLQQFNKNETLIKTGPIVGTSFTNFQNIYQDTSSSYISGEIYCPTATTYKFVVHFAGPSTTSCSAQLGPAGVINVQNGVNPKEYTVRLNPGTNLFSLQVNGLSEQEFANARILITEVSATPYDNSNGYDDLVIN